MESRKSKNIYIPKCFMAFSICINILVLCGLEVYVSVDLFEYRQTT